MEVVPVSRRMVDDAIAAVPFLGRPGKDSFDFGFGQLAGLSQVAANELDERLVACHYAERFLAEGAKVVIGDVDAPRLKETAADIGTPDQVLAVVSDVSKKDQVDALVDAAVKKFGRIDIMVNNAGIALVQDFLDISEADYDRVLSVNLKGAFMGTQAAARKMVAQGQGGVIINMSSIIRASPIRALRPTRSPRVA